MSVVIRGNDLAVGGTATASTEYGAGYEASKAIDNNNSTRWSAAVTPVTASWIYVDLGASKAVYGFSIYHYGDGAHDVATYKVQKSDDGSNWTDVDSYSKGPNIETVDFSSPVTARYFKILPVTGGASGWTVYTIRLYEAYDAAIDDANTVSLLHLNGSDTSTTITDETGKPWTAQGNAQIDTAHKKFGAASGLFDGSGDYLTSPDCPDWNFGTADWTVDLWLRRNGTKAYPGIWATRYSSALTMGLGNSDNKIRVVLGASEILLSSNTVPDLTWTHVALVRYGNVLTVYIGGTACGTYNCTGVSFNSDNVGIWIGRLGGDTDGYYWDGWMDEIRVSKGIARWTANFSPPTGEYGAAAPSGGRQFQAVVIL